MIYGVITYLLLATGVAFLGKTRTLGFFFSLVISLLFTPIIGLIIVISSPKLILYHVVEHECPECGFSYDKPHDSCPSCLKEGKYVILNPNVVAAT